VSKGE